MILALGDTAKNCHLGREVDNQRLKPAPCLKAAPAPVGTLPVKAGQVAAMPVGADVLSNDVAKGGASNFLPSIIRGR